MDRQSGACSAIFRIRLVCQLVVLGQTSLAVVLQLVERFAVSRSAADRALRCRTALELPDCCDSLPVYNGFFMNIQRQRTRDGGVFPPWRSCCCSVAVSGGSNASAFALHHSGNRLNWVYHRWVLPQENAAESGPSNLSQKTEHNAVTAVVPDSALQLATWHGQVKPATWGILRQYRWYRCIILTLVTSRLLLGRLNTS